MRRSDYRFQVALAMLAAGVLAALASTVLHRLSPAPLWLDRVLPPALALWLLALLLWLWREPDALVRIARLALGGAGIALAIPAWVLPFLAEPRFGARLVDLLPPVAIALFPVMVAAIAFLPYREALRFCVGLWLVLALPILVHLARHAPELRSPVGLQLVVALGPASLMLLALLPLFRGIQREVASLAGERDRMQSLAERDPLTGLYNRRAGEVWLQEAVREHGPGVGVILFDIDRFKQINDRHGHAAGDAVLHEVARRTEAALRRDDRLMRWGGEEFLVLLRGVDAQAIGNVAEALRHACRGAPIDPVGPVTASFGSALWQPGEAIEHTLARADAAMYAAKQAGRDRVVAG